MKIRRVMLILLLVAVASFLFQSWSRFPRADRALPLLLCQPKGDRSELILYLDAQGQLSGPEQLPLWPDQLATILQKRLDEAPKLELWVDRHCPAAPLLAILELCAQHHAQLHLHLQEA